VIRAQRKGAGSIFTANTKLILLDSLLQEKWVV